MDRCKACTVVQFLVWFTIDCMGYLGCIERLDRPEIILSFLLVLSLGAQHSAHYNNCHLDNFFGTNYVVRLRVKRIVEVLLRQLS